MAYSPDLRKRVLDLYDEGFKTRAIARQLRVCESWCRRVKQRRHEPRRKIGGGKPKLNTDARTRLAVWVGHKPDSTLEELRAKVLAELNIQVSVGCLWNTLRAMKFTLKKSR